MTSLARQADELSTPTGIVEPLNSEPFSIYRNCFVELPVF